MKTTSKTFAAFLAFFAATCVLLSQESRNNQEQRFEDPIKTVSVDVDVVLIPTTVTNDRGLYISGLEKQDFHVFEDRVEQEVTYFSTEDAPMSLGIVLDSSGSMTPISEAARRNGGACMNMGTEDDEYFLIVFSDKLKVNTDFTTDLRKLRMQLLTATS